MNSSRRECGRAYSLWMAGGGVKGGITYGETDEFSYNVVRES